MTRNIYNSSSKAWKIRYRLRFPAKSMGKNLETLALIGIAKNKIIKI